MALAKKCDICEKLHEHYGLQGSKRTSNHIRFLYIDNDGYSNGYISKYDCCPECLKAIYDCIDKLKEPKGPVKLGDLLGNTDDDID